MIDREVFKQEIALLADRIGRTLAGPTQVEYYRILSAELSTEQFVAAMTLAFRNVTGEFRNWPSPAELVALITPVAASILTAAEAFERVLEIAADPRLDRPSKSARIQALGASAVRAFRAAGGFRELENVLEAEVRWVRRNFVEAYASSCENAEAERAATLALASTEDRIRQLVTATAEKLSEKLSTPAPKKQLAAGGGR